MLSVAGFGLLINFLWSAPSSQVLSFATNTSLTGLLNETNSQRQSANEPVLRTNAQLTAAAQAKANDMASRNYWSHVTPDGHQPWWFVTNAGYEYQSTGENLAYGFTTSQATVIGWMNSPGHRANILNAEYQDVGFGIANAESYQNDGQQTIVVALYGRPLKQVAAAPAPASKATPAQVAAKPSPSPTPVATVSRPTSAQNTPTAPAPVPAATAPVAVATPDMSTPSGATAVLGSEESLQATPSRSVARLEALHNISPTVLMAVVIMGITAAMIFVARHGVLLHRFINRGEQFVVRHWKLDVGLVSVLVVVLLLTQTAGFIQ